MQMSIDSPIKNLCVSKQSKLNRGRNENKRGRWDGTAFHQGLSKYLTAQDTHVTPTLTKHSITLARIGNLVSLHTGSTIQLNRAFSVPSII